MITKYTLTLLTLFCMSNIAAQTLNQAKQWFNEGKFAEAKPVFQRLVKQAPSNANYNFWYGACCFETGELAESQPYLEKSADRKVINAYLYLGKLYYTQYRFDDAVENLEEHISWLEKKERDTEEAEKVLSKCRMAARMIRNTERIIVADSFVVDKASFLQAYKLSKSAGEISITENGGTCYTNEWGDKMLYTQTSADGKNHLYSRMKLIDKWSDPQLLKGITLNEHNQICPFLNTDGITLYYATDGEENLGGYDIFITRYDSEDDTYLRPNNIGMPFNSPANDYMYAIDETNHLGWFASDRYQPEGKVCIYVFIPNDSKQVYDFENTDEQIVINAATLKSIQSTWDNTNKVQLAKQQIQKIINEKPVKTQKYDFQFIINDKNVYHALSDFHSDEARQLFNQFRQKEKDIESLEATLIELRETYQQATSEAKSQMVPSILEKEKRIKELHNEINKLTEQIRNTEINALK